MDRRIVVMLACIAVCFGIVTYKIKVLHFHPRMAIPVYAHRVSLRMSLDGHGRDVSVRTFLPPTDERQKVSLLRINPNTMTYRLDPEGVNQRIRFSGDEVKGNTQISYSCRIRTKRMECRLPDSLGIPGQEHIQRGYSAEDLAATPYVQKDDPTIAGLAERLGLSDSRNAVWITRKTYEFVADSLRSAKFSARTDALLALRLREASCNGKSRLMVALLRHRGIPARLVGGLIINRRQKRTTHQWVEVCLGGKWIPFCPLNGHYASIPDRYVSFYRGDHAMFERTGNINFDYAYRMDRIMLPREHEVEVETASLVNALNLWETFRSAGVPLELLRILLMIPLGAVVIIIFRNVIGIHTFGTFLPVLIATAYRDTGLLWGTIVFGSVVLFGALVRSMLQQFRLLHSPKLTIILVTVIAALIGVTLTGIYTGNRELLSASMFPLAIIAITVERFSIITETSGMRKALTVFGWTLVVVGFCYLSMLSVFLQSIMMTFPEALLLIVAASMYLGAWNHVRLSELFRFRELIFKPRKETA